jgi:beta-lactamase regulating signal transducer with metallopeptidase domain/WD40 repeat protein
MFNLIPQSVPQRYTKYAPEEVADESVKSDAVEMSTGESAAVSTARVSQDTPKAVPVTPVIRKEASDQLKPGSFEAVSVLPLLWLAGALVLAVYVCAGNFHLWWLVTRERPLTDQDILDLLEDCKSQMGIRTILGVVVSDKVKSPALFGFIRPRLLLPAGMIETISREELRYVFLHELAHLKRHDIYVGYLSSLLQVLHWFNPLIWLAFYRMRADRELACDALVLARLTSGGLSRTQSSQAKDYGRTIVSLLERFSRSQRLPAMAGILETKAQLKRRITMIARFKKNSYQWSPLAIILIIMLGCVSLPDAKRTKASETLAAKPSAIAVRQVWIDAADPRFTGAVSPDGKYLSYVDWETGDQAVHDLATGKNRRLTNEGWDKGFALRSVFSPDSKQLAYYWWNMKKEGAELRIVGLDGSGDRAVNIDKEAAFFLRAGPDGWSADGKHILARGGTEDKSLLILLVPVEDGPVRVLKILVRKWPLKGFQASLSPDGRYVAYSCPSQEEPVKSDIFLLATDGSHEIPLVEHPADDFVLGWAPDGKRIVFASDRTGSMGIWAIEVADGEPQGAPQLLKPEVGQFRPLGFTENGSYYYGVYSGGNNVYVATFDPQKGNVTDKPIVAIKYYEGSNWAPDWSPDGRYLACVSLRPGVDRIFLIHSVETGKVRELSTDLKDFNVHSLRWSPDGRSLLGVGKTKDVRWGILKIEVETGNISTLAKGRVYAPDWAADGKAVFYLRRGGKGDRIVRYDLITGEDKDLHRPPGFISGFSLSPDRKQFAFQDLDDGKLKVLSVASGQPRELVKVEGKITVAWTPDGCQLVYGPRGLDEGPARLWRIPAEGGEPQKLDLEMPYLDHVRFHPDGRKIAFTGKADEDKTEVWVMENFLPVDVASAAGK